VKYRHRYEPLLPSVYRVPFPYCYRCPYGQKQGSCAWECVKALEAVLQYEVHPQDVAAVVIEPQQGEGGYIPAPVEFLRRLSKLCRRYGILLIFDEVQTGFGRTARWFAAEHYQVEPDVIVVAKGIASGFPISALGARRELMDKWPKGAHGTTFGGNPVSCAAAVTTIRVIEEENLLEHGEKLSLIAFERLNTMRQKYPVIGDVRGLGLMIGVEIVSATGAPAAELTSRIVSACRQKGLILITCGLRGNVLRFLPPLITTAQQLNQALDILEQAISSLPPR
jgi:4-aminobutyrate aminotransferase